MRSDIRSQISEVRLKIFFLSLIPYLLLLITSPALANSQCPEDIYYPDVDQGKTVCVHKYAGEFNNQTGKCDYTFDVYEDLRYCSCNDDYYYPTKNENGEDVCFHKHGGYFDGNQCQYAFDLEPDLNKCNTLPESTPTPTPSPTTTPTPTPGKNPEEKAVNNLTLGTKPPELGTAPPSDDFFSRFTDFLGNLIDLFWTPINNRSTFYGQSENLQQGEIPKELVAKEESFLYSLSGFLGNDEDQAGFYKTSLPKLPGQSSIVDHEVTRQERDFEKAHFPEGIYPVTEGL